MHWDFAVLATGRYQVAVVYAAAPECEGNAFTVGVGGQELRAGVEVTGDWGVFVTHTLGPTDLREAGPWRLEVRCAPLAHGSSLMNLREVTLRRVGEARPRDEGKEAKEEATEEGDQRTEQEQKDEGQDNGGDLDLAARTHKAMEAGLAWLDKAQEQDGRWSCERWGGGGYDLAVTALALRAYLGAGHSHRRGPYRRSLARAIGWLLRTQKPDGSFAWKTFYEQGIATIAICEALGRTRDPSLQRRAQAAIAYVCAQQPEHGGYRYKGACAQPEGDLSVTSWQITAMAAATKAGLRIPPHAHGRCRLFLRAVYRDQGQSAYVVGSPGPGSAAMAAAGMYCRLLVDRKGFAEETNAAAGHLLAVAPEAKTGRGQLVGDLYFTYYSVRAMALAGGPRAKEWDGRFRERLLDLQQTRETDGRTRFIRGSWDPANHTWASRGGRVYATAMALLCLETKPTTARGHGAAPAPAP
ncbi:MAG: hypothetical protein ACODAJ_03675 [Planctomycetota bacterium]